ncbi:MAG: hypothetical protein ACOYI6_10510, partial [Christensenellales bacterium]
MLKRPRFRQKQHVYTGWPDVMKNPKIMLDMTLPIMIHYSGTPNGAARTLKTVQRREAKKRQSIQLSETAVFTGGYG